MQTEASQCPGLRSPNAATPECARGNAEGGAARGWGESPCGWLAAREKPEHLGTRCASCVRPAVDRWAAHSTQGCSAWLGHRRQASAASAFLPSPFSPTCRPRLPCCLLAVAGHQPGMSNTRPRRLFTWFTPCCLCEHSLEGLAAAGYTGGPRRSHREVSEEATGWPRCPNQQPLLESQGCRGSAHTVGVPQARMTWKVKATLHLLCFTEHLPLSDGGTRREGPPSFLWGSVPDRLPLRVTGLEDRHV